MSMPRTLRFASMEFVSVGRDLAAVAAHARRIEDAGFSALIVNDDATAGAARVDRPDQATQATSFEPLTLTSALATLTDRIGLVATATTDFNEPFHVARRLATLDHLSAGRAGWNVDTRTVPRAIGGFIRDDANRDRRGRAEEFMRIVRGLWDSYADDAIVADKGSGLYFRAGGRRPLDHVAEHFEVAGPLNVSRSPQGHPVVFHQAASPESIAFAGRHADVVLTADHSIDAARATRRELDAALHAAGRRPADIRLWPGIAPIVTSTEREAKTRLDELRALRHDNAPDPGPPFIVGTAPQIAEHIGEWYRSGAADGFAVTFLPAGSDSESFLGEVLPLLAQHGHFGPREGTTLRDDLGLARPERNAE